MTERDRIFANPLGEIDGFEFDQRVVGVFPDMIQRSVPGYASVIAMTGTFAARFAQPESQCYDLGCSLGASSISICSQIPDSCRVVAVDNSPAMINEFRRLIDDQPEKKQIDIVEADMLEVPLINTSLVVLNFALQFVDPEKRTGLVRKIYDALKPGGAMLISEKIAAADPAVDQLFIDIHGEFKRRQGYSELEIAQKRAALENVLVPDTIEAHIERCTQAGFRSCTLWFQCLNFCSMIAIR